jgi:putative ABC transport system permease protein
MLTATIRGMLAHKLRLVLTTTSIMLGVAFLAGTFILTDTMKVAFNQLFGKISAGTDAVVRQEAAFKADQGADRAPIPASVLATVRSATDVRVAEGDVFGYALMTDTSDKAILPSTTGQTMGLTMPADVGLRGDVRVRNGHAPSGPTEVAIDARSAADHHVKLGSHIKVLFHGPTRAFTVVGIVTFGGNTDLGGNTTAYFDLATAQSAMGRPGVYDQINVSAKSGVTETELATQLNAALPPKSEAMTGAQIKKEFSDDIASGFGFVTILLSVFAAVALFVGSFIIWNTFTMIVSQRSREIALLRAVGATRRQVLRSLLIEASLVGLGASLLGLLAGIGVAKGLSALMGSIGFSLPSTGSQIQPRTIVVSLLVGTVVTVIAALVPARRATKVLPVEALRDSAPGASAPSRRRAVFGSLLGLVGVAALGAGLFGGAAPMLIAVGVVGVMLGVSTLAPIAARPMASLIGRPLQLRGLPGELARQNAMRNPRRTASTASALMIGLTLVVSVGVFASSLKGSFGGILGKSTNADLFVTRASEGSVGFSTDVVKSVATVPGVAAVSATGFGSARFAGAGTNYASVDPATAEKLLNLDFSAGGAAGLGSDGVLVRKSAAQEHGWKLGSTIVGQFAATGKHSLRVVGIYDRTGGFIDSEYVISQAAQAAYDGTRLDSSALVLLDKGADRSAVQKRIQTALHDHPDAKVQTQHQFEKSASGTIDKLLIFVTVMLLLAVVIALLGIVNTLALSVFERTRELGLLRAVGMTKAQVRTMVRWESVVISLIGALAGAGLGIGFGVALAKAMSDKGIKATVIPYPNIALYVGAAAVAGILAAIGPARSAAKVDVLKAVVTD